jgi:urease subunit gamma/beta
MYLTPTEEDRLRIFAAADLARRTRADGALLNAPEATALICDAMHRAARLGADMAEVIQAGRRAVRRDELMDGIPALLPEIRLEVLLEDGRRLVVLRDPWGTAGPGEPGPGDVRGAERDIEVSAGKRRKRISVTNRSARAVRVSSHYPFWLVNPRLEFDRPEAMGFRLDLPAGASLRWGPGEARRVDLVESGIGGPPAESGPPPAGRTGGTGHSGADHSGADHGSHGAL